MDLNWTDDQWNGLFQKMGMLVCSYNELNELSRRYRKQRCMVEHYYDINQYLSEWDLKDVKYRHDTDDAGNIYVAITGTDPYNIELFKDEARTDKVAEATGVDAGDTATLEAEDGHFVHGTVKLSDPIAADDLIFLKVKNDYRRRVYDEYGVERQYEADMRASLDAQFFAMGGSLLNLVQRAKSACDGLFLNYLSNQIHSAASRIDNKRLVFAPDGSASVDWGSGILADLADAMLDNDSQANVQYVGKNTVAVGTLEADDDNIGEVEKIDLKCGGFNWAPNGTLVVICTTEGVGNESFDLRLHDDDNSVHRNCRGGFRLKTQYMDLEVGIKLGLRSTYKVPATGLGPHTADFYSSGEDVVNTSAEAWWVDYIDDTKVVNVYSDWGKTKLVAQGVWDEDPESQVTCEEQNGSGLTITFKMMTDPTEDKSMMVEINCPKVGDKWYVPFTNKRDNIWATFFGEAYRFELPDSGDHEIPEELACKFHYPAPGP